MKKFFIAFLSLQIISSLIVASGSNEENPGLNEEEYANNARLMRFLSKAGKNSVGQQQFCREQVAQFGYKDTDPDFRLFMSSCHKVLFAAVHQELSRLGKEQERLLKCANRNWVYRPKGSFFPKMC